MGGKLVVVAGATGYLGRYLVKELHGRGYRVRALVRSPERLTFARPFADEIFVGQATQPETLKGLCRGAHWLVSSLGVRSLGLGPTFWEVDRDANLNLLKLAQQKGVEHFLFVSVFKGELLRRKVPQAEAREQVVDELFASSLKVTVVRPTGFFNDMAEFFRMASQGRVWLVGDGSKRLNPIHGADLAAFIGDLVEGEREGSFSVGGPEGFSQRQIGELAFQVLRKTPSFSSISPHLLAGLGWLFRRSLPNFSNFMYFMSTLASEEALAPPTGKRKLVRFFEDLSRGVTLDRAGV